MERGNGDDHGGIVASSNREGRKEGKKDGGPNIKIAACRKWLTESNSSKVKTASAWVGGWHLRCCHGPVPSLVAVERSIPDPS